MNANRKDTVATRNAAGSAAGGSELVARLQAHSRRQDDRVSEELGVLTHEGQRLIFLMIRPRNRPARAGVVVCHSLFEFKMLQSAEVAFARSAASCGYASIYIQAPGSGDSEGSLENLMIDDRVGVALAAFRELSSSVPEIGRACMFGARLGAAVAALAAQRLGPDSSLVLWDPVFKADDYWTQGKRFARVVSTLARDTTYSDPDKQLADKGRASLLGYTVSAKTVEDLAAIDRVTDGLLLQGPSLVVTLNDKMLASALSTVRRFAPDVEGASLGRPKPRHVIHMGVKEATEAVGASVGWMQRRLS